YSKHLSCCPLSECFVFCSRMMLLSSVSGTWLKSLTAFFFYIVKSPRGSGACNFLGVPVLSSWDVDDDEGEVVIDIRPKSSPLPRRKSSVRVSFADAKGLNLVQVKEFDTWDVPKLPGYDTSDGEGNDEDEYILSPLNFSLPLLTEELLTKVQEQKVELEKIELLPGTTIVKGVVRVLNISFTKAIYVRTTLDCWSSHFDLLAEYIPGSSDGLTDCFSFTLTLWPPFRDEGARVDFCLRYETPVGTFWANNANKNYVLSCFRRTKENDQPQKENVNKKSCLKTAR
uniref:CBM21 domain-containing protein n=1 Tax=Oreochromis aureus TaxID=47969 RepID=A0A668SRD0_OREAU